MSEGARGLGLTSVVLVVFVLLVIAWLVLPGPHGTPINRWESATVGDVRSVVSAQAAYASANGGFYEGRPECLVTPARCIPGYAESAPTFLDPRLAQAHDVKAGYRRVFHPGPPPDPREVKTAGASASSVTSFAVTAAPVRPNHTGVRWFCGDSEGRLCVTAGGAAVPVENGLCAKSCQVLQ